MRWLAGVLIGLGCGLLFYGFVQAQEKKAETTNGDPRPLSTWPSGHGGLTVDVRGNNNNVSAYQSINYTFNYYVKTGCNGQRPTVAPYSYSVGAPAPAPQPASGGSVNGNPGWVSGSWDPLAVQFGGAPEVTLAPQQGQPWSRLVPPLPAPGTAPAAPAAPAAQGPGTRLDVEQIVDWAATLVGTPPVGLLLAGAGAMTLLVPAVRRRQLIDI